LVIATAGDVLEPRVIADVDSTPQWLAKPLLDA
jgi:hypothetical protein